MYKCTEKELFFFVIVLVSPRARFELFSERPQAERFVFLKSTPSAYGCERRQEEEPPRLVRSPERIHCPSGTRIDRRQVYPPHNPFYSFSKNVFYGKNDPTESLSTFCKDSIILSSLLRWYILIIIVIRYWCRNSWYHNWYDNWRTRT